MRAWTDYPIEELGDTPGREAPVRECEVIAYDGDKYCDVIVEGVLTNFKCGYLYSAPGRSGEAPRVTYVSLALLPDSVLRPSALDAGRSESELSE